MVTAKVVGYGVGATCNVTVSKKDDGIRLNLSGALTNIGDTCTITATFTGISTEGITKYEWKASGVGVATVEGTGSAATITVIGAGVFYVTLVVEVSGEKKMGASDDITVDLGLVYSLNSNGEEYTVTGLRSDFAGTNITIPATYNGLPVTKINNSAFENNTSITSVKMTSVTSIGSEAFSGCTSLESVVILSEVASIGEGAFRSVTGDIYFGFSKDYYDTKSSSWKSDFAWNMQFRGNIYFYSENDPGSNYSWTESVSGPPSSSVTVTFGYWHYDSDGTTMVVWTEND